MTAAGWAALAITIFGAFSYGAGSVLQAVGARRSRSTVSTLGHPLYLIGVGCDLLAWAGSMIALRELAVYFVESVLAGSLAVTVIAARLFLGSRLRRRDVAAVVVTIAALTVLAMSAGPQEQVTASGALRLGFCAAALAAALIGWGATKIGSPGLVAAVGGLSLGGAALCGRALSLPSMSHPAEAALAIVTEPLVAALVVFAAAGMLLYTSALQHGQVGPVTAVLWISEVVAPSAVALVLLGDAVRPGWSLAATVAGLVTVGAAVLLATAPATSATAHPTDAQPLDAPRQPIPVGGRTPAALPSRDSQFGTILWWGSPTNPLPIWRPPDRRRTIRPLRPAPMPVSAHPYAAQAADPYRPDAADPYRAQPVDPYRPEPVDPYRPEPVDLYRPQPAGPYRTEPSHPYSPQPAWAGPRPPDAAAREAPRTAIPTARGWPATQPARAQPVVPQPSPAEWAQARPEPDRPTGPIIWSGPPAGRPPISRPPDR